MADRAIRIRVGAVVSEQELSKAFNTAEKRAQKAHQNMLREQRKAAAASEKESQRKARAEEKAAKQIESAAARVARTQIREQQKLANAANALQQQRSRALFAMYQAEERAATRAQERIRRELEKTARAAQRAADRDRRSSERVQVRRGESFARRTSHRASRFLMPEAPIGSMAMRGLGDVARGAGVDLSIQGGVQRSVELQTAATALANQERIATGKTRGAGSFAALGRKIGDQTFSDPGQSLALASTFAARTGTYGNLEEITPQLASLARASGAKFDEVGSAAGMVFNQLKNEPDAIQKTIDVMRTVIGQSAEGAVEMADYASQIGRISAGAFKFAGDRGRNIAALSALTQISMERGATSAADAARSTGSFVSTLGKGARLEQFEAAGVPVYTTDTVSDGTATDASGNRIAKGKVVPGELRTVLRPLEDIIKDSFRQTGGDIPTMGRMFMDVLGRKGVESLGAEFQAAGGGEKGIEAIQRVFDRYMRATISKDVEKKNIDDVGNTPEARAKKFQNELDKVTESVLARLLPALEAAGPAILKFAQVVGSVATWAVENPKTAIAGAITMSIARAGLESTFRAGIERLMLGANNEKAGKLGKTVGAIGGVGTVAALALTAIQVAAIYADAIYDEQREQATKELEAGLSADDLQIAVMKALKEGDMASAQKLQEKAITKREEEINFHRNQKLEGFDKFLDDMAGGAIRTFGNEAASNALDSAEAVNKQLGERQVKQLAEAHAQLAAINEALTNGIKVEVTNQPGGDIPGRDSQQ
jgi:hypothetical protein